MREVFFERHVLFFVPTPSFDFLVHEKASCCGRASCPVQEYIPGPGCRLLMRPRSCLAIRAHSSRQAFTFRIFATRFCSPQGDGPETFRARRNAPHLPKIGRGPHTVSSLAATFSSPAIPFMSLTQYVQTSTQADDRKCVSYFRPLWLARSVRLFLTDCRLIEHCTAGLNMAGKQHEPPLCSTTLFAASVGANTGMDNKLASSCFVSG